MNATRLGALVVVFGSWAFAPGGPHAQNPTRTEVRKVTRGPFEVGIRPQKVTVEITTTTESVPGDPRGDRDSFVVRGRDGEELLRRDERSANARDSYSDMGIVPAVVPIPDAGAALLIMRSFSPSAPGTGEDGQFFGFTREGRLVPITGIIAPTTNDTAASNFHVTRFAVDGSSRLAVEVEEWADNFTVLRHYPIDPEGAPAGDAVALEEKRYKVRIDAKEAARDREDSELDPVVTLRSAPSDDAPGQLYVIEASSTIEFLDAAREKDQWWIHVKIDGREGYVSSVGRELDVLGLPSAG
jgi:hypothetical protein